MRATYFYDDERALMGYAITVDRFVLDDKVHERLAHVVDPQLEAARVAEIDQFQERLFDGAAHRREVPVDALAQLKTAESRALESEMAYMRQNNIASRARFLYNEAIERDDVDPKEVEGAAAHRTSAEAEADRTRTLWNEHKTAHTQLKIKFKAQLDPAIADRVRKAFDDQIARSLNGVAAMVAPTGTIRFQLSGHVEDDFTGHIAVHIWPME